MLLQMLLLQGRKKIGYSHLRSVTRLLSFYNVKKIIKCFMNVLLFQRLNQAGCFITTSENVIYKLIGDKDHPKFNEIRPLIKERSAESGLVAKM